MIKAGQTALASDFIFFAVAGENLTANDSVYIDASDGKAYKTDSDVATKIDFAGFAQETKSTGATVGVVLPGNVMGGFSGLTIGADYFVGPTPGAIVTAPGTYQRRVGKALSATTVLVRRVPSSFRSTMGYAGVNITTTFTCGFRAKRIILTCFLGTTGRSSVLKIIYDSEPTSGNVASYGSFDYDEGTFGQGSAGDGSNAAFTMRTNNSNNIIVEPNAVTATGFNVAITRNTAAGDNFGILIEAYEE